jgi:hypothetical protein
MRDSQKFLRQVEALGVIVTPVVVCGANFTDYVAYHIDNRDVPTKAVERKITKIANTCEMKIAITDKGASFE